MPLADYAVIREISRDQLAVTQLARERDTGRPVVLTSVAGDAATVARFLAEVETVRRLDHPAIAAVLDLFEEDGSAHVVTDWIEGRSLRDVIGRLSPAQAMRVVEDVLSAVDAADHAGVAHLELRPENVLVTADGEVQVTGFGLGTAWPQPRPSVTAAGGVRDVAYIAPEQVLAADVGPAADLYAIGCMAYELLTGRPPFHGSTPLAVALRHVDTPLPDPREADPSIAPSVAGWVARMTQKAPADRFADAGAASVALEQALAQVPEPVPADDAGALLAGLRHGARAGVAVRHVSGGPGAITATGDAGVVMTTPPAEAPTSAPAVEPEHGPVPAAPAPRPPAHAPGTPASTAPAPPAPAPPASAPPDPLPAGSATQPPGDVDGQSSAPPAARRRRRLVVTLAKLAALAVAAVTAGRLLSLFTVDVEIEAEAERDVVDCTVFAPPAAVAGEPILVQVFVHLPVQEDDARALATELDAAATRRAVQGLETEVARGSRLRFGLRIPGAIVDEPVASLVWRGRPAAVQFGVVVPPGGDARTLIATVDVTQDSIPIGHVKFKLGVRSEGAGDEPVPVGDGASRYRSAFLSYASEDRDQVLRGAQMLRSVGIAFFQDVVDLDPGERWEQRLYAEIERHDLFLLFWSRAAARSEWVRREARWALDCRHDDADRPEIKPVILERPPSEPWPELAHLHFNDPLAYFASGAGGP